MLKEAANKPGAISQHAKTVRKKLNRYASFGMVARGKTLLKKKEHDSLGIAKLQMNKQPNFW